MKDIRHENTIRLSVLIDGKEVHYLEGSPDVILQLLRGSVSTSRTDDGRTVALQIQAKK